MVEDLEKELSELWSIVELSSEEMDRVVTDLGRLNRESVVKGEILWENNLRGRYSFVLKMKTEKPTNGSDYIGFINAISGANMTAFVYGLFDYTHGKTDREITTIGKAVLEKNDTPTHIKYFLNLIRDGYPTNIIKKMEVLGGADSVDLMCQENGYIVKK